jgi:signal transduction histidine kinase/CheY-like chemotaxis protein
LIREREVEAKLLYAAYDRKRLNIVMTVAAAAIGGAVLWPHFPPAPMLIWVVAIMISAVVGYVEWLVFRRVAPARNAILRWQRIFLAQTFVSGAAWAIGPTLMMQHTTGAALALLVGALLCVCAVAMTSVAQQRDAMQAFIVATLLPPAVSAWFGAEQIAHIVALVLVSGMALMIVVGRDFNKAMRTLLEAEFDLRSAVEEARAARESAERDNLAKSDFLSSMSHELRTPMNAILGFAQMLESDAKLNADQHDNVHEILKGGRHLLALINELLDLAGIESGHVNLFLEPVNLADLVEDCQRLMQPLANARRITLHLDVSPQWTVQADRVRLKQVFLNLLSNAVKYNREGGNIRLGVQASSSERLRVAISDDGDGIAAERIDELFQPFSRLDAARGDIEGTGIGLTIVRRLVELMGGVVGVDSRAGIGSTFWVELPSATPSRVEFATQSGEPLRLSDASMPRRCVLCIDDEPANLRLIAEMLGLRRHIELITADTAKRGIELAVAHRPDLILLDLNMPVTDGYQVLQALMVKPHLKSIPIIAVSANAMPRDIERGRAAGFSEYLSKPLHPSAFLLTIDRYLTRIEETKA